MRIRNIFSTWSDLIQLIGSVAAAIGLTFIAYQQFSATRETTLFTTEHEKNVLLDKIKSMEKQLTERQGIIEHIVARIDSSFENVPITNLELKRLNEKILKLDTKINDITKTTLALRQAINPLNPEEILTIARLGDEINSLAEKIEKLESKIEKDQESFKNSIIRELEAADKSTNLMLVVLIPLVLNLIYSFLKDRKKEVETKKDKT